MPPLISPLRAHPRLLISLGLGLAAAALLPVSLGGVARCLLGWNVMVWLYLLLVGWMMLRADHRRLRRLAAAQGEAAATVLAIVSTAAVVSLVGVVIELTAAKLPGAAHVLPRLVLALGTVLGAWVLVPTVFTLTYASLFYRGDAPDSGHAGASGSAGRGLAFPGEGKDFKPDYFDFLYFSFTIAVASQTADVAVTSQGMRRLVLLQSLLSFGFNTAILAFTVNLAASMF
jgi:uncharacterized membrane protein